MSTVIRYWALKEDIAMPHDWCATELLDRRVFLVLATDYDALAAELAESRQGRWPQIADGLNDRDARIRELEAENASLRAEIGELSMGEWIYNAEWKYWGLMMGGTEMVTLEPRPAYCDRGHWFSKPVGMKWIDAAHGFPRYYMDLDRAKAELSEWVAWRLKCEKRDQPSQDRKGEPSKRVPD